MAIAFTCAFAAPRGAKAEDTPNSQTFTVAAIDWCPQICPKTPQKPGYLVEFIDEIFAGSGLAPQYSYISWSRAVASVNGSFYDTLLSPSKDEAPKLTYHTDPIAQQIHCIYKPENSVWHYTGPESLNDIRLVIYKEHSYDKVLASYFATRPTQLMSLVYDDRYLPLASEMLKRGRAGAFLFTRNSTRYHLATQGIEGIIEDTCIKTDDLWLALAPEETELRQKVRAVLDRRVKTFTSSPRYREILAKYHIVADQ